MNSSRGRCARRAIVTILILAAITVAEVYPARAQDPAPIAPDAAAHGIAQAVDWQRFDRLGDVARQTVSTPKLSDLARSLRANVPGEAGRLRSIDLYYLGSAWFAYHYPGWKGRAYLRDASSMEGEELYRILQQGYRIDREQANRIYARLLTMLGIPSEVMTGLVRGKILDRGVWVLCQIDGAWLRADVSNCVPAQGTDWRPPAAFFQTTLDLEDVLAFLKTHLPDGEQTARQQGLKRPLSLPDWQQWSRAEQQIRAAAERSESDVLYSSRSGLFTPNPVSDSDASAGSIAPPTPEAISALEQLRRKPVKPTRGAYLAATARKYVGLPYIWGGEDPERGFDCSGLVHYVCRTWGISMPRTAAEQYHVGHPVAFMDLEPGDLVFLANTYKPGVSHVGMYIGDGLWVQAVGTGIGITVGDVPYFDAGTGPGARRLDYSRLPTVAGEPAPLRSAVVASRHAAGPRPKRPSATHPSNAGPIVSVKVCGDTGLIANSGCDTYKLMRMPKALTRSMGKCRKHKPRSGERW